MPYIDDYMRPCFKDVTKVMPQTPGQLNYAITKLIHTYIENKGGLYYDNINQVIGVLECIKLELYRVIAAKYEDKKRRENGPISDLDSLNLEDVR